MDWSEDVSQEVADLRAATQTDSAVLELDMAGNVRHASDAWFSLVGIDASKMIGRPIGSFVCPPDKDIFVRAAEEMRDPNFTGGSVTIWVAMHDPHLPDSQHVDLEAQGIIIKPQGESERGNVMWLVSRYSQRPAVSLQLPHKLTRTTGFATDVFAAFLEQLADAVRSHAPEVPAYPQELCRICERFVKTWWFERHHWLCSVEHKNEERVNASLEAVHDHRDALLQMMAHPSISTKHAVRVSSPLARSEDNTPTDSTASEPSVQPPAVNVLQKLIEVCDRAIELDIAEAKGNDEEPLGPVNAKIVAALKNRPTYSAPESLDAATEATNMVVNSLLSAIERYSTFIRYRRVLWAEVEEQVRQAIDATVAAAESTTATVLIEANSPGSTDEDAPDEEKENQPVLETDDEEELKNVLHRKRGSRSHQRSRDSPRNSPHPSPRLSPHMSPHLSPKLWPSTPSRRISRDANLGSSALGVAIPIRRHSTASMLSSSAGSASSADTDPPPQPPSIRDYDIIKAISRGAYGVVYLARKRLTGEFFAIKVLKKSDMVAKNQVTHVKHERQILISTASSPYVATLFFTFQSRDFLFLVMEYVPGGDCAALLKSMGCFSEEWAKQYIAEVIVAVDSLHSQGILHRDLKPDNLLIDKKGHLKLSDFGLSATTTTYSQAKSRSRTNSFGSDVHTPSSPISPTGTLSPLSPLIDRQRSLRRKGILGTPDYLAPETIEGMRELTESADWWAVGCIFFELLYGFPPFNDETPQKVFANILKCKILWPDIPAEVDVSDAAKELILSFLVLDPQKRLGAKGSEEVMAHSYFKDIEWRTLFQREAPYTPEAENPLSTMNFDDRGAQGMKLPTQETDLVYSLMHQDPGSLHSVSPPVGGRTASTGNASVDTPSPRNSSLGHLATESHASDGLSPGSSSLHAEQPQPTCSSAATETSPSLKSPASTVCKCDTENKYECSTSQQQQHHSFTSEEEESTKHLRQSSESIGPIAQRQRTDSRTSDTSIDEFGSFTYRNLPVLEKANNEVITKIRDEERRLSVSSGSSSGSGLPNLASPLSDLRPSSPMYATPAPHVPIPRSPSFLGLPANLASGANSPGSSLSSSSTSLAQQNEDTEKEAAVLRVRRRQQMRRSFAEPGKAWYFPLNVLLGGSTELATKFIKLGCRVIVCSNGNDVCLKANSAVHFDLIVLDLPSHEPASDPLLTNKEVCRIIRSTMNPNRETSIVQVRGSETNDADLPSIAVDDEQELIRSLKSFCSWESSHEEQAH